MDGSEPVSDGDRSYRTFVPVDGEERFLVAGMLLWMIAFPLLPPSGILLLAPIIGTLTLRALWRHHQAAGHLGVFSSLYLLITILGAVNSQISLGLTIIGYLLIVWATPWLRSTIDWMRWGLLDRTVVLLSVGFAALSGVALILWHQIFRPDLQDLLRAFVPDLPIWILLLGGVPFSMVNAAVEEVAYRGVLLSALRSAFATTIAAVIGQALAFGILHFHAGFPRGIIGVLLAVVYGGMMAILRLRSDGMLAPWGAHVLTDMTIILILLFLAR